MAVPPGVGAPDGGYDDVCGGDARVDVKFEGGDAPILGCDVGDPYMAVSSNPVIDMAESCEVVPPEFVADGPLDPGWARFPIADDKEFGTIGSENLTSRSMS